MEPLQPMDDYVVGVVRNRQRGNVYPYELIKQITHTGYRVSANMSVDRKKALDFSGGVSCDSNIGTGGVEKIAGPNGQVQIRVPTLAEAYRTVYAEKQGELGEQFDKIHDTRRAKAVGSIQDIVAVADLRSTIVRAVERGMEASVGR